MGLRGGGGVKTNLKARTERKRESCAVENDDVDRFYTALFSTLEQTHCTLVACDSKWVTVAFYSGFYMLFGCCDTDL